MAGDGAQAAPEPLSATWRAALARRLAAAPPAGGRRLALGQVVTGEAGGEVAWTVHAGGGEPAELVDGDDAAEVCLVGDAEAAAALLAGTPAATLLAEGRIKVRGDASALVETREALASLAQALPA